MEKGDIKRVAELEKLCFRTPWSENALKSELKNRVAVYRVGLLDDRIITYAGMWVMFDEAHITNVAVDPECRGHGYGRRIMLTMMQAALQHGAERMTLEVREHNAVAQNLYYSMGFYKNGVRKRYYSDSGEDAFILWNDSIIKVLESAPPVDTPPAQ